MSKQQVFFVPIQDRQIIFLNAVYATLNQVFESSRTCMDEPGHYILNSVSWYKQAHRSQYSKRVKMIDDQLPKDRDREKIAYMDDIADSLTAHQIEVDCVLLGETAAIMVVDSVLRNCKLEILIPEIALARDLVLRRAARYLGQNHPEYRSMSIIDCVSSNPTLPVLFVSKEPAYSSIPRYVNMTCDKEILNLAVDDAVSLWDDVEDPPADFSDVFKSEGELAASLEAVSL